MMPEQFEPLRRMEAFTEDMFNRIISFQEKQHPAWNDTLSFSERIKNLPLHYLVFSNADRDAEKFAPTVANYYPLRHEMQKLAYYIKQCSPAPKVCDLYCGNGFIGSLLAREGVPVTGLQSYTQKPNQITSFYDKDCYQFSESSITNAMCNVVLASWVPPGSNPTAEIIAINPSLIIYVYTDHKNPDTGERQTGSDDMFDKLTEQYKLIDEWTVTRPENLFHEIWPDLTPSIEEQRITRVYANKSCNNILLPEQMPTLEPYDWEQELHMAQLAMQAKQQIRARGFQV